MTGNSIATIPNLKIRKKYKTLIFQLFTIFFVDDQDFKSQKKKNSYFIEC